MPLRGRRGSSQHCGDASASWRVIANSRRRDTLPRSRQKDTRGATAKVARLVAAADPAGSHGARCWCETRGMADLDSRGWSPRSPRLPRHAQAAARQRAAGSSARGLLLLLRRLRHAQRPAYDVILKIGVGDLILAGADAPAHRNPRLVHGLGIARNEWVPPVEVASLGQKAIGATGRQPYDSLDISGG